MNDFSHSFAVCAYKESPFLRDCLQSLKEQEAPAQFFIATSTPNEYIKGLAADFGVPLFENSDGGGLGRDWNYAYSIADTDFVTIAHQDDVYDKKYLSSLISQLSDTRNPILAYTDYVELRGGEIRQKGGLLSIKRVINAPMRVRAFARSRFMRSRALSMGCAICCPSVCLNKKRFPDFRFSETLQCDLDWDAWSRLAKQEGAFVYLPRQLMGHRIHEDSETTAMLSAGIRTREDYEIFHRYWPAPIARLMTNIYSRSEKSNTLEKESGKAGGDIR